MVSVVYVAARFTFERTALIFYSLTYRDRFRHMDRAMKEVLLNRSTEFKLHINQLSINAMPEYRPISTSSIIEDILDFENISSLGIVGQYEELDSSLALRRLLIQSKNLEALHLEIRTGDIDGILDPSSPNYILPFARLEVLAPLRKLTLRVDVKDRPQIIPLSAYDFTVLQTLHLQGPTMIDFISSISGMVPRLKVLKLRTTCEISRRDGGKHILEAFLTSFAGLEILQVNDLMRTISVTCLASHGRTLKELTLRSALFQDDSRIAYWGTPIVNEFFSPKELDQLRELCPEIRELVLDVDAKKDIVSSLPIMPYTFCFPIGTLIDF